MLCRQGSSAGWARKLAGAAGAALLIVLLAPLSGAQASVVRHGYLPLADGTELNYTLTLPSREGRYPVVLKYDPYAAGAFSDPTWNDDGYATLGVNMRGTGCSAGEFHPVRADIWGADGADIVAWAAKQPWSSGSVGMIGYSFTGTSQLATAAYAGPALKAITPGNVFPDLYRDMIYPGGIYNAWISVWIAARNYSLGADAAVQAVGDVRCAINLIGQVVPNELQTLDPLLHPNADDPYWAHGPSSLLSRVHLPVLGCVNWQDSTVYSHALSAFREQLAPETTWVVGANGLHSDCPIARARLVRFFDRYLKQRANGWESTPHMTVVHEQAGKSDVRESLDDHAGAWETSFRRWSDLDSAIRPLPLYLRSGGRLDLGKPVTAEHPDAYRYPLPSGSTPVDWAGFNHWENPALPGGSLVYTTPRLARDAEFLGGGSADLWVASTATDTDLQVTLSEVGPGGKETYVENGWLRLSHRRLGAGSTALRPQLTYGRPLPLVPGRVVGARLEILPFDHVFRAGSAIRLTVDAPGGWFAIAPQAATNRIYHRPGMESRIVLGWLPSATAKAARPACGSLLNQPCRPSAVPVPGGTLTLPRIPSAARLQLGRVAGLATAGHRRPVRVRVRARGGVLRGVRLTLRDRQGRRVGKSPAFGLGVRTRVPRVAVTVRLKPGRYTLTAAGLASDGTRVRAVKRVSVRRRR